MQSHLKATSDEDTIMMRALDESSLYMLIRLEKTKQQKFTARYNESVIGCIRHKGWVIGCIRQKEDRLHKTEGVGDSGCIRQQGCGCIRQKWLHKTEEGGDRLHNTEGVIG